MTVSATSVAKALKNGQNTSKPVEAKKSDEVALSAVKRDSVSSVENEEGAAEGKRKSTGSISSLRKMWESTENSPALGGRKRQGSKDNTSQPSTPVTENVDSDHGTTSPTASSNVAEKSTVKFEKRVWPPVPNTEMEKPMVPVKPTVQGSGTSDSTSSSPFGKKVNSAPPTSKPPPPKVSSGH